MMEFVAQVKKKKKKQKLEGKNISESAFFQNENERKNSLKRKKKKTVGRGMENLGKVEKRLSRKKSKGEGGKRE